MSNILFVHECQSLLCPSELCVKQSKEALPRGSVEKPPQILSDSGTVDDGRLA